MTKALYLEDSYLKECDATVISSKDNKFITLDQTVFYPRGGGQPYDTARIVRESEEFNVLSIQKSSGEIFHETDRPGLNPSEEVHCILDWDRRYKLMRSHTAAHVLAMLLSQKTGALITGNQLETDQTRFDFNLENFDRDVFLSCIADANDLFKQDIPVRWYELPREEALKIPTITRLANVLPPNIPLLRIVEIVGYDKQADGGTHVKTLREVGRIEFLKAENKGKNNRRVYCRLSD